MFKFGKKSTKSNTTLPKAVSRKRRTLLNWEGVLEGRTLLAYDFLGAGLTTFFGGIQAPVNSQVTGTQFPLIGNSLSTETVAQIFDQNSPGHTSLMAKASGIPGSLPDAAAVKTAVATAFGVAPGDVTVSGNNIKFLITGTKPLGELPFDLGIPALNLNAVGEVNTSLTYSVLVNANVTDTTFAYVTTDADEIQFDIAVDVASLDANGKIGPLHVNVTKYAGGTNAAFGIDVDIVSATPNPFTLSPKVKGNVNANLGINANFLGFDAGVPKPGLNPTLQTQFQFAWFFGASTSYSTANPFVTYGSLSAGFPKIELNLGTTIQGMMQPVGEYLDKFAGPFMRIIEPFRKQIPIVDKSVLEILVMALPLTGDPEAAEAAKYLEQLDFLIGLYEDARNAAATGVVDLGSVSLTGAGFDIQSPTASVANLNLSGTNTSPITTAYDTAKGQVGDGLLEKLQALGIEMPIFPSAGNFLEPFKLLLGQPADLVKFTASFNVGTKDAPKRVNIFDFPFTIGPIPCQVTGDLEFSFGGNMVFGLDTSGIIADPTKPQNGFYLQTPLDKPLFEMYAGAILRAGVGNRSIARIGVEGGLKSDLVATLGSGNKIYFPELDNLFNSGCAVNLAGAIYFEIGGFIEYICGVSVSWDGVEPKYCEETYPVGRFDIYEWTAGCDPNVKVGGVPPQPVLAEVLNGTLYLNMGPRASLRGQFTNEINEEFAVSPLDPANPGNGSVVVTAFGFSQTYTGVERVNGDGGSGDDVIQLLEIPYLSTILGGTGNDNLKVSLGASSIDGGDGNDSIFGGQGNDFIFGGLGNDYILLGWGEDTVYGGGGDDYVTNDVKVPVDPKNKNNKYIDGGDGNDELYGGTGYDTIFGQSGMDTIGGGLGTDILVGGDDHDTFIYMFDYGSQTIDGGSGQNEFEFIGGDGTDRLSFGAIAGQIVLNKSTNGTAAVTMTSITDVSINLGDGADFLDMFDLSGTSLKNAAIFLGLSPAQVGDTPPPKTMSPDNFADEVLISGSNLNEIINIVPIEAPSNPKLRGTLQVAGTWALSTISSPNQLDKLTVNGLAGNDQISALASATLTPPVKPEALVRLVLDGSTGDDILSADATLIGGPGNDTFIVPVGTNTIDGGTGTDIILVEGTDLNDDLDVSQTNLGGGDTKVDIRTQFDSQPFQFSTNSVRNVELIKLNGLGGDDRLLLSGTGLIPVAAYGGFGNDTIDGTQPGIVIATAVISAYGEQGIDTIRGGAAGDQLSGGDDADQFLWNAGNGSDVIDGGTGSDSVVFTGTAGTDCFHVAPDDILSNQVRVGVNASGGGTFDGSILAADVEHVSLNGGAGNDLYEIKSLSPTAVNLLDIDYGPSGNDVAVLMLPIEGAAISVTPTMPTPSAQVNGLPEMIRFFNASTDDTLRVEGGLGNDVVKIFPQVLATMSVVVDGREGDDSITGAITAMGGAGDDTLTGTAFGDILLGGLGKDSIDGLAGDDLLLGDAEGTGAGTVAITCDGDLSPSITPFAISAYVAAGSNDTIKGGEGNDSLNGGFADDMIYGDASNDLFGFLALGSNPLLLTAFDEPGADSIWGGTGADSIDGAAGNDEIYGEASMDVIRGGLDNDKIWGGEDADLIYGNEGNDAIYGDAGADTIYGNEDNDAIYGDAGNDSIVGNNGDDSINSGSGNDTVHGGLGNDYIDGDEGNDSLCGGPEFTEPVDPAFDGNDTIFGGGGNDAIDGNAGDDLINGGAGNDQLWGSDGNDTIGVFVYQGETQYEPGKDSMAGGTGDDLIRGALVDENGKVVNDGNDIIFGQDGNDTLWGGGGGDMIYGGNGEDVMLGGTLLTANTLHKHRNKALPNDGNDTMLGGDGFDEVDGGNGNNLLDAGNDSIRETVLAGAGNDMAYNHMYTDPTTYDIFALDGGFNHKFHSGGLLEPPVPAASCDYITWTIDKKYLTGWTTNSSGTPMEHPPLAYRTKPKNGPDGGTVATSSSATVKIKNTGSTVKASSSPNKPTSKSASTFSGKSKTTGSLASSSAKSSQTTIVKKA
jgi:Ca2+-binding RTX toxin-like protein